KAGDRCCDTAFDSGRRDAGCPWSQRARGAARARGRRRRGACLRRRVRGDAGNPAGHGDCARADVWVGTAAAVDPAAGSAGSYSAAADLAPTPTRKRRALGTPAGGRGRRRRDAAMTLSELLERVGGLVPLEPAAPTAAAVSRRQVAGVECDSRQVSPGAVFVALKGAHADGATFAQQAIVKGAVAVISESDPPAGWSAPWLRTMDARKAL